MMSRTYSSGSRACRRAEAMTDRRGAELVAWSSLPTNNHALRPTAICLNSRSEAALSMLKRAIVEDTHEGLPLADDVAEGAAQPASLSADLVVLDDSPREERLRLGPPVVIAKPGFVIRRLFAPLGFAIVEAADAENRASRNRALGGPSPPPRISVASAPCTRPRGR